MPTLPKSYQSFQEKFPEVTSAYEALGRAAAESGPLGPVPRELIKLGMAAAAGSRSAVESHTHRALEAGATPDEIVHAITLGVTTLGFPTMMAALTWATGAIENH